MKKIIWYTLLIAAVAIVIIGFLFKSWAATILAAALCIGLKKTNNKISIPKLYINLGIKEKYFDK